MNCFWFFLLYKVISRSLLRSFWFFGIGVTNSLSLRDNALLFLCLTAVSEIKFGYRSRSDEGRSYGAFSFSVLVLQPVYPYRIMHYYFCACPLYLNLSLGVNREVMKVAPMELLVFRYWCYKQFIPKG